VKARKEDKLLRELFRKKLEDAEVIPSESSGEVLLRRLGRKEFLRFNPSRFNIWYAGAVAAAGAAALIIYLTGRSEVNPVPAQVPYSDTEVAVVPAMPEPVAEYSDRKPDRPDIIAEKRPVSRDTEEGIITATFADEAKDNRSGIPEKPEVGTITEKIIIPRTGPDSGKLRISASVADNIIASVREGCCPLKVIFRAGTDPFERCRWSFGDGGSSDEEDPEWIFDVEGEYKVTLQKFHSDGSESVSSGIIKVNPRPAARFEIIDGDPGLSENRISFINYSTLAVKFRWDFGDGNSSGLFEPVHIYSQSGNYNITLIVTSEDGCTDTLTVSNAFTGKGNFIDFPNAFLPNLNGPLGGHYSSSADDAASIFHPVSSGVSEYQLRIFSKSGMLIFESNDINIGWDGYYKGSLCQSGVYIWKVRGNYINGESFTKMGDLTLLKY